MKCCHVHCLHIAGIDYVSKGEALLRSSADIPFATAIVNAGRYEDDLDKGGLPLNRPMPAAACAGPEFRAVSLED